MATLRGRPPKEMYKNLLQIDPGVNSGVDSTLRRVEDGEGENTALHLSKTTAQITGTLEVSGGITVAGVTVNPGVPTSLSDIAAQDPGTAAAGTNNEASRDDHVHNLPAVAVGDSGSGGVKGLVPAPGTGDAAAGKFLKADMTYATTSAGAFTDTSSVVVGSADATKELRFEVDGLTTGTVRVMTMPDKDLTPAEAGANGDITSLTGLSTPLTVAQGGSGAGTFTDGGILLGSGTGAVTALAAMADGEMVVGDGTTDPVLESGATLRTSIGVAIGSNVQAFGAVLDDLNTLGAPASDGQFIVATGAGVFAYESGATALTSIGGIGAATPDTLTNKTFNANGTGNSLSNVDVADLANGTDGELITWDASGVAATVAVGTSGNVLTSNGVGAAPTFQAAAGGGGAWNIIGTAAASNSATLTITGLDSTYDTYAIGFSDMLPATDPASPWLRLGDSSGVDSGIADYEYTLNYVDSGGTDAFATNTGAAQMLLGDGSLASIGGNTGEGIGGIIYLHRPGDGTTNPLLSGHTAFITGDAKKGGASFWGERSAVITVDRVQFLFSTGNITSGRLTVWGLAHA